jgi:hypothetical protein
MASPELRQTLQELLPELIANDPAVRDFVLRTVFNYYAGKAETESRFDRVLAELQRDRQVDDPIIGLFSGSPDLASRSEEILTQAVSPTSRVAMQETKRQIQAMVQENRRVNQQVDQQLDEEFGIAWHRFAEELVPAACEQLFANRGIPVNLVSQRGKRRRHGDTLEFDVLVANQGHVLAVEVKSSLDVADVKRFIADLERFSTFFPEYAGMQLYGAVAAIGFESEADRYAYRQGLFVLAQSGDGVVILNDAQFQPKAW